MNDRQIFLWEKIDAQYKGMYLVYPEIPVESFVDYFTHLHKDSRSFGISLIMSLLILLQTVPAKNSLPQNCYL